MVVDHFAEWVPAGGAQPVDDALMSSTAKARCRMPQRFGGAGWASGSAAGRGTSRARAHRSVRCSEHHTFDPHGGQAQDAVDPFALDDERLAAFKFRAT